MADRMSKLFQERAVIVRGFCERVGSYELNPEQGLALMTDLGIKNVHSLRGVLYRIRDVVKIKVKIPITEMDRQMKTPPRGRIPGYIHRVGDQGQASNGFCPRCPRLFGRSQQTALTRDKEGYIYCLACAWEEGWTDGGLALTATV